MTEHMTTRLSLPLVQQAQAQKHVTVNESLARLDGLVNLVLVSSSRKNPPGSVIDGACFAVPAGAGGDWAGQDGQIAIASNNGWTFAAPLAGMRAFVADNGMQAIYDGDAWVPGALSLGGFGSALCARTAEAEVSLSPGTEIVTDLTLPAASLVIGATARVVEEIRGSMASWRLGTTGAADRFGSGLGVQAQSWARGMLSQPFTYWEPAPVILSATGGSFISGKVRIAAHWLELTVPR